jgi:hypothetical protein
MANLLETLNTSREETISKHYGAAFAELKGLVEAEPLKTEFNIYAGCVSDLITKEISRRLEAGGVKSTVRKSGVVTTQYYLNVKVDLPENLRLPEEKKEEPKEVPKTETEAINEKESVPEPEPVPEKAPETETPSEENPESS